MEGQRRMDGASADQGGQGPLSALSRRLEPTAGGRLGGAMLMALDALHDLVERLGLTRDELRLTLEFLTEVGHHSDARRQEWVLLADVIGVSALVEDRAAPCPDGATPNTLAGPFYRADAPDLPNGADLSRDGRGEAMSVSGRVSDLSGLPVVGALVEVWQANSEGRYENQEPDLQPEFNLRGRLRSDSQGRFHFRSVKPRGYALPEDGPVGRLMNSLGLRLERPAHVHFRVSAEGYQTLTTLIFDRDDPSIGRDALFGVKPELLGEFRALAPTGGATGGAVSHALDVSFVLGPAGSSGATPTRP